MGFSSEQGRWVCKNHPAHEEKQGVCPSCLRDRLFRLNHAGLPSASLPSLINTDKPPPPAAAASHLSPFSSSRHHYHDTVVDNKAGDEMKKRAGRTHHRNASSSDVIGSMSSRVGGGNAGLKKCRSVAASYSFAPQPPKAISRRVDGGEKIFGHCDSNKNHNLGYGKSGVSYGYGGGKKKKGFWTKLLHLKPGKNKEVLIHHPPPMAMKGTVY